MNKNEIPHTVRRNLTISYIAAALSVTLLLGTTTYAWIRRQWNATIADTGIKIEANGSMAFKLYAEGDPSSSSEIQSSVSLTERLGAPNFSLKPVSNFSGLSTDFFRLNLEGGLTGDTVQYQHLSVANGIASEYQQLGLDNGYIEFTMYLFDETGNGGLTSEERDKHVYIKEGSYIRPHDEADEYVAKAIRVSMTVNNTDTYIFKNADSTLYHTGINNTVDGGLYIANNQNYNSDVPERDQEFVYNNVPYSLLLETNNVHYLSDFNGAITPVEWDDDNNVTKRTINSTACLLNVSSLSGVSGNGTSLTVRIWLEGTDEFCTEDIAGLLVDVYIAFEAVNTPKSTYNGIANTYEIIESQQQ